MSKKGNPYDELTKLLKESGAVEERRNRHVVYKLPNGRKHTVSCSPSDRRAVLNNLSDLKKTLKL
jgi:hypothetical protein